LEGFDLATLEAASVEDIQRLLELFPASSLKQDWDYLKGRKEELCAAIAKEGDHKKIRSFVISNFARCKQHSYIFGPRDDDQPGPEMNFPDADGLGQDSEGRLVYLGIAKYTVLLNDPFSKEELELLWPMRIEYRDKATIVSFVVLERDVTFLFDRQTINVRRHDEEKDVILGVESLGYEAIDLNKGIKALWAGDSMDAFKTRFKKARSTTTESMDKERGIKETEPQLYEQMRKLPMFETMFRIDNGEKHSVRVFQINPTGGVIRMTRYTEGAGDSDELINEILAKNF
jgi:hypothetical protein